MNPVVIIQARMGSTRLPGKVLLPLGGRTVLEYVIQRCRLAESLDGVVVATTLGAEDRAIWKECTRLDVPVFFGSAEDVLQRYLVAAEIHGADPIVRITADCPFIDPALIDRAVCAYACNLLDLVQVVGHPRGTDDVDVISPAALQMVAREMASCQSYYREHVVTYLLDHADRFAVRRLHAPGRFVGLPYRLCIDELADYQVAKCVAEHFWPRTDFSTAEIVAYLAARPWVAAHNRHVVQRNPAL